MFKYFGKRMPSLISIEGSSGMFSLRQYFIIYHKFLSMPLEVLQ